MSANPFSHFDKSGSSPPHDARSVRGVARSRLSHAEWLRTYPYAGVSHLAHEADASWSEANAAWEKAYAAGEAPVDPQWSVDGYIALVIDVAERDRIRRGMPLDTTPEQYRDAVLADPIPAGVFDRDRYELTAIRAYLVETGKVAS